MFRKAAVVKNNTPVRTSKRKQIREQIMKEYPVLTEDDLNNLIPRKEILNDVKIITNTEEIQVYAVQRRPVCFEFNGKLVPSLYLLWKHPNIVQYYTTHKNVLNFINSGADLMLPGVLTPPSSPKYGVGIKKDDIVAINLSTNKAAFAVGFTNMSSSEMEHSDGKGKCVTILHLHGDKLCSLVGQSCLPIPNFGAPECFQLTGDSNEFPVLGQRKQPKIEEQTKELESVQEQKSDAQETEQITEEEKKEMTTEEVDELLNNCFFTAIKYSKTLILPILTSNFYKLQMLPACPVDKTLDIKKSSFKRLKPYLVKMSQENIIAVIEFKKGVESIVAINKSHPKYIEFYLKPEDRPGAKREETPSFSSAVTSVTESYVITQNVLPIFNSGNTKMQKGDTVLGSSVKKYVREYVMNNKCQHENPKLIQLDPTLCSICKSTNPMTWEEVYEKVCAAMKNCFIVQSGKDEVVTKGKVNPIVLSVGNRTENKKVTLVDNLGLFGINISEFAKECQHGVAASTSISLPPGKKTEQLLVQGNQILFVHKLLVEKYKIPKRYIQGLENAPKKKK